VKTRVFLAMKNGACLSPNTWYNPNIYCSKQIKRKLKTKTTDAPRKTHSAWSNKNIVSCKVVRIMILNRIETSMVESQIVGS
jgi:hypothetical protein